MVLIAGIFLTVQGFSQAHAAANFETDHTHDGVACDIGLISAEEVVVTPPVPVQAPSNDVSKSNWTLTVGQDRPRTFDGRAPPPRGPPTH